MVIRGMCKYGNDYMMLDIDHKLGVRLETFTCI